MMDKATAVIANVALLRSFCDSLEEAKAVMARIQGSEVPGTWLDVWLQIESEVASYRAEAVE